MRFLADVNVVFPLLLSRHPHRATALDWFDSVASGELILCRLARLGVLRLLTTRKVMGPDVLTPAKAWQALAALEADDRVVLLHEPDDLDEALISLVGRCSTTPKFWSDAYLAAFAHAAALRLVSFDRGFRKFKGLEFLLLGGK